MVQEHSPIEPWVGVDEVAAHLGVRKDSVYRWIEGKALPARKIGKLWKLRLSEVDAWIQATGSRDTETQHAARRRAPWPISARRSGSPKARILVIDDDETVCTALQAFLSDEGYESVAVGDGAKALDVLRCSEPAPDLILLDLTMPVMDGRQFRDAQLQDEALARIPVIVVTAERFANIPGVAAVLHKPLNLDRLAQAIEGIVCRRPG